MCHTFWFRWILSIDSAILNINEYIPLLSIFPDLFLLLSISILVCKGAEVLRLEMHLAMLLMPLSAYHYSIPLDAFGILILVLLNSHFYFPNVCIRGVQVYLYPRVYLTRPVPSGTGLVG